MAELGEKLIELRLTLRRACMCEDESERGKSTMPLKTKVLYLISRGTPPKNILAALCINKANFSIIARELCEDSLVEKRRSPDDKRAVFYSLTALGEAYLNKRIRQIEARWLTTHADTKLGEQAAIDALNAALKVLDDGNVL